MVDAYRKGATRPAPPLYNPVLDENGGPIAVTSETDAKGDVIHTVTYGPGLKWYQHVVRDPGMTDGEWEMALRFESAERFLESVRWRHPTTWEPELGQRLCSRDARQAGFGIAHFIDRGAQLVSFTPDYLARSYLGFGQLMPAGLDPVEAVHWYLKEAPHGT